MIYLPSLSRPFSESCNRNDRFKPGLLRPLQSADRFDFLLGVPNIRGGVFNFFLNSTACSIGIGPARARTTRGLRGSLLIFCKKISRALLIIGNYEK